MSKLYDKKYVDSLKESKEFDKLFNYLLGFSDSNIVEAIEELVLCYKSGIGTEPNEKRALELSERTVELGSLRFAFILGFSYEFGTYGAEKNQEKADYYYKKDQERADQISIDNAILYEEYDKQREQGLLSVKEVYQLGLLHYFNHECEKAISCLEHAADNGYTYALVLIGNIYATGRGCSPDLLEAMSWYQEAALRGEPVAQRYVGVAYYEGTELTTDYKKAYKWLYKAALSNDEIAQIYIGFFYEKGIGIKEDNQIAVEWYGKAFASHGHIIAEWFENYCENEVLEESEKNEIEKTLKFESHNWILGDLLKKLRSKYDLDKEKKRDLVYVQRIFELEEEIRGLRSKLDQGVTLSDISSLLKDIKAMGEDTNATVHRMEKVILDISSFLMDKKRKLADTEDEDLISEFTYQAAKEIVSRVYGGKVNQSENLINNAESELKGVFGSYWDMLDHYTRRSLVSAKVFLAQSLTLNIEDLDFSGIVVSATSALENELKLRLFVGFQDYLASKQIPISNWPTLLKFYNNETKMWIRNTDFTLGKLSWLLYPENKSERPIVNEYLKTILHNDKKTYGSGAFSYNNPVSFISRCKSITNDFRNKAAHTEPVIRTLAEECCDNIIGAHKRIGEIQGLLLELIYLTENYKHPNL